MKRIFVIAVLLFAALSLTACQPDGFYRGGVLLEGDHQLPDGDTLEGDLLMLGGKLTVSEGAAISGSVYVLDGWLAIDGTLGGDVQQFSGLVELGPEAQVEGTVRSAGGQFTRLPEADIAGEVNTQPIDFSGWRQQRTPLQWIFSLLVQLVIMAGLAALSQRFFPTPVGRVEDAIRQYPHVCAAVGGLAFVIFPVLIVMMAFTVVLIPVSLLGLLAAVQVLAYAGLAYGRLAGVGLNRAAGGRLSMQVAGLLGTILFVLVINLVEFVPVIGSLLVLLAIAVGAGAILLTRFGFATFQPLAQSERIDATAFTQSGH